MHASDCPPRDQLSAYLLGTLPEDEADKLIRHLEGCSSCDAVVDELEGVSDELINQLRSPASPDRFFYEKECREALRKVAHVEGASTDAMADASKQTVEDGAGVKQLGDYKLLEELDRGGMGTVYRALHVRLGREVALKVLPKGRMMDRKAVARFEREMMAIGRLDHPNIVRATDASEAEGVQFLAMELLEGYDFSQLVDYCGPLRVPDACELVRQAAVGLQCAHENGLVHRDIKPSNVMVTFDGVVKILDLGLARFQVGQPEGIEITAAGQPMGTADYMAPEQVRDTHSVDIRADIYSLGCTFYKLLAGQPPFGGVEYQSSIDKMMAHRRESAPPIQAFRPDLPTRIVRVLDRMLDKNPNKRFSTPTELVEALTPLAVDCDLPSLLTVAEEAAETPPEPKDQIEATDEFSSEDRPIARKSETRVSRVTGLQPVMGMYVGVDRARQRRRQILLVGGIALLAAMVLLNVWMFIKQSRSGPGTGYMVSTEGNGGQPGVSKPNGDEELPPVVRPKPVPLDIRPERLELSAGAPLSRSALVVEPAAVKGAVSWTVETRGHRSGIESAAKSPDDRLVATGNGEGVIRVWDRSTGTLVRAMVGYDGAIRALSWSPDGRYLAAGYSSDIVRLWEVASGLVVRSFPARCEGTASVAWSPDGRILAYVSPDAEDETYDQVHLWDATADNIVHVFRGQEWVVRTLAWSPAGKTLATGAVNTSIKLWDVASGKMRLEIQADRVSEQTRCALAWSPNATKIVASCAGEVGSFPISIWDTKTGELRGTLSRRSNGNRSLFWSPDGKTLVGIAGGGGRKIRFWNVEADELESEIDADGAVLAPAADGTSFFTVEAQGLVRSYDAPSTKEVALSAGHSGVPSHVSFSPDGEFIAWGSKDGTVQFWEIKSGQLIRQLQAEGSIQFVVWSPDGKQVATSTTTRDTSTNRTLRSTEVWNAESGERLFRLQPPGRGKIVRVAWSPDGKTIATVGDELRLWKADSGKLIRGFLPRASGLAWLPNGKGVAVGSDANVAVRDIQSGRVLSQFSGPALGDRVMAISPDGTILATTGGDTEPEILLWKLDTDEQTHRLSGYHRSSITTLGWREDGRTLVSGSSDEVCLWDTESGKLLRTSPVSVSALSPDTRLIATGGASTIRLYHLDDDLLLGTLLSLREAQFAVFSAEGHRRGSPGLENEIVYVVQTDKGQQTLKPAEFSKKYNWKNDPKQVKLGSE